MAKVPLGNKFQSGRFFGGDDEEPQDAMYREESETERPEDKPASVKPATVESEKHETEGKEGSSQSDDESDESNGLKTDEDIKSVQDNKAPSIKSERN